MKFDHRLSHPASQEDNPPLFPIFSLTVAGATTRSALLDGLATAAAQSYITLIEYNTRR